MSKVSVVWNEQKARQLKLDAERILRQLEAQGHLPSHLHAARFEILLSERGAAYESRDMELYRRVTSAIVRGAREDFAAQLQHNHRLQNVEI